MANKFIIYVRDGQILSAQLSKPQAPRRLPTWLRVAKEAARVRRARFCAFRFDGKWHILDAVRTMPIKDFPADAPKAAVEMHLLHIETRR